MLSNIFEVETANFLTPDSIFILVVGMTGSGKSSFIADCRGREDVQIGSELESCTSSVAIFKAELQGRDVFLIDTPGFDDTDLEVVDILTAVAHYLSVSYAKNVWINGIIYLHRISDTRIGSSTERNLDMMKAIYAGSQIIRHDQCQTLARRRTSAREVLHRMFDIWKDTQVTLQMQHEMIDLNLTLEKTTAGKILGEYIENHQVACKKRLQQSQTTPQEPQANHESEIRKMLADSSQALEAMRLSLLEIHKKQEGLFLERFPQWRSNRKKN
ncbi:hypothetical protein GGR57DRAFT_518287 [Xylariaceae sp. FL1272]|nr:hypothetical protein GGR57DRAFT_518287 [Xylariaceae sp. FL1272]